MNQEINENRNDFTGETEFNSRKVDQEMVENLALGLTSIYHPVLKAMKKQLVEMTKKQEFLCSELHKENLRLSETIHSHDLQKMFSKIKLYKEKLLLIKRDMLILHEQSTRLKKRALHLEEEKQMELLEKVQKREYEEQLIGKPSTS